VEAWRIYWLFAGVYRFIYIRSLFGNGISEASAVLVDGRNISHKKPTGMYTTCGINFLSTGTRTGLLPSTVCFAIIKRNICCKRKASLKHAFVP